jgi:hypothetical protein
MAIAIPWTAQSKPFPSGMGNLWENTSSASIPMISVMSYQYPPLPHADVERGMSPPGFMPSYIVPSQQLSLSTFNVRDPQSSNQEHDMKIKGTFSSPTGDPLHPAGSDEQPQRRRKKKRNKLGYRRTSAACGK